jgi:hypothetical protein
MCYDVYEDGTYSQAAPTVYTREQIWDTLNEATYFRTEEGDLRRWPAYAGRRFPSLFDFRRNSVRRLYLGDPGREDLMVYPIRPREPWEVWTSRRRSSRPHEGSGNP